MKINDLGPGDMRECVEHWTLERVDDGAGGWTRDFTLAAGRLRVAWEESAPVNTITGEVLSQRSTVQMGVRRRYPIAPEDIIVHDGRAYRVIGARVKVSRRWKVVALEQRDERSIPQQPS